MGESVPPNGHAFQFGFPQALLSPLVPLMSTDTVGRRGAIYSYAVAAADTQGHILLPGSVHRDQYRDKRTDAPRP